jgi:hypothetical protein
MATYEPFDPDTEVTGRMVRAVVDEAMGQFSETYRASAFAALAAEGIDDPAPDEWYPQSAWLNAFETIAENLEPHVLDRLGEQIPNVAAWPTGIDTPARGLESIDEAYQRNHRNGDTGHYRFDPVDERTGAVTCQNPYPCPFDRGIVRGVAREYAPVDAFVFVEETGDACRRRGDDACTFTVSW